MISHHFPTDPEGKKVLGMLKGGIGDVLMIASVCSPLTDFTFCVSDYQVPLVNRVEGCKAIPHSAHNPSKYQEYDAVVNFMFFLSVGSALKSGDYYSILECKIAHKSPLAKLDIPHTPVKGIYLHPQASNPNRDWERDKWEAAVAELVKLDQVYVLGRKSEYAPRMDGVTVLADESEDLVWQAEQLATAKHFVGVDSGFCHIAGMIGVPSTVLFFNTIPEDVIARYPNSRGISAFNGKEPSRSTKVPCETSNAYKKALTVEALLLEVDTIYNSK